MKFRFYIAISLLFCLTVSPAMAAVTETLDLGAHDNALAPKISKDELSTPTKQLALQIGVLDNIDNLKELRNKPDTAPEVVYNRQIVLQGIVTTMLEVRATSAQIAYDIFKAGQLQNFLQSRRDRQIRANSIANFVSGGVSEVLGGSFQLSNKLDKAGNIMEILGGGLQTGLSTIALRQERGEKKCVLQQGNMLQPIFDPAADVGGRYPDNVWKYLCSPPPGETETRRNLLIKEWLRFARLKTTKDKDFLSALTGASAKDPRLTIDLLGDRQAMLSDLDALVSQMDKQLLEIMLYINH